MKEKKFKLSVSLIKQFIALSEGGNVPSSAIKGNWLQGMLEEGLLCGIEHGSHKSYHATDTAKFKEYLRNHFDISDLQHTLKIYSDFRMPRGVMPAMGAETALRHNGYRGFLVHCCQPLSTTISGTPFTLPLPAGSAMLIVNFQEFVVPEDTLIVGVEHSVSFLRIAEHDAMFRALYPNRPILYAACYPSGPDLADWLILRGNEFIFFGDLDLAAIAIYQRTFYSKLGEKSSFFLPSDYEQRVKEGSHTRFNAQIDTTRNLMVEDGRLEALAACVRREERAYSQEQMLP